MIILVRVGTPHLFFHKSNTMVHDRLKPYTTVQNSHYSFVKTETSLSYIEHIDLDRFMKMINMFRVGTPQPFLLKNWTQWCMTGLNLIPHFKDNIIIRSHNRDILIIYRQTRSSSVHENYQHVPGWNPTTIYFQNRKNENKIKKGKNRIKLIFIHVDGFFCNTPINISIFIYLAQSCELSGERKMEICIIRKSQKLIATKL